MNKEKSTLVFNRVNGCYLNATNVPLAYHNVDNGHYILIEDVMDLELDTVVGGLLVKPDGSYTKNYNIMPIADIKPRIFEKHLNVYTIKEITEQYPLIEQINILARAIQTLSKESEVKLPELDTFVSFVDSVKTKNRKVKQRYIDDPECDYITEAEQAAILKEHDAGIDVADLPEEPIDGLQFT